MQLSRLEGRGRKLGENDSEVSAGGRKDSVPLEVEREEVVREDRLLHEAERVVEVPGNNVSIQKGGAKHQQTHEAKTCMICGGMSTGRLTQHALIHWQPPQAPTSLLQKHAFLYMPLI